MSPSFNCRPPWIFAAISCVINARHAGGILVLYHWTLLNLGFFADQTGERFFHTTGWWFTTIVGYIIGVSTMSTRSRYVSIFLMTSGNAGQ